jgi:hypothetical protein
MTTWHDFSIDGRVLAFSWDGYRVERFSGSAAFVEDDESYARESMKRSFDGYDPELLARDLKALAITICDAVGASPEYRAAVLATIDADAKYDSKIVSREPTAEEAATIEKLLPVIAALANNNDVRVLVRVNRNCDPPCDDWGVTELEDGAWGMMHTPEGHSVWGLDTLEELAHEVAELASVDAAIAMMKATDARNELELARQRYLDAASRSDRLLTANAAAKAAGW